MKMGKSKLIVFDMDGVIVDVSRSYRDAVRLTAKLFFKGAGSHAQLPDPLFSLADLARVKQAGGLNNDWELTYHVITLLLTQVAMAGEAGSAAGAWEGHEQIMTRCDVSGLARFLNSVDTPLQKLHAQHRLPENRWVDRLSTRDVNSGNIIKQIFQEIYLGGDLFEKTYGIPPRVCQGEGLIDRESLLMPPSFFDALSADHLLAIATGRPRAEAEHALNHFSLQPYFKTTYTLDECLAEEKTIFDNGGRTVSLSKPHPFMLDAIADACAGEVSGLFYIGDMPDDMVAASRSSHAYTGIGIIQSAPDKEILKDRLIEAGADTVVENTGDLMNVLCPPETS